MLLARENPSLTCSSCSPGFIETDLTRPFATAMGKTPADMGMKAPDDGVSRREIAAVWVAFFQTCQRYRCGQAVRPLFLTLGDVPSPSGSAWFFGSDAKRSPLDKYREPGDPPYDGGESVASASGMGV